MSKVTEMKTTEITEELKRFMNNNLPFDVYCEDGSSLEGTKATKSTYVAGSKELTSVSLSSDASLSKNKTSWILYPPAHFDAAQSSRVIMVCEHMEAHR